MSIQGIVTPYTSSVQAFQDFKISRFQDCLKDRDPPAAILGGGGVNDKLLRHGIVGRALTLRKYGVKTGSK